MLFRSGDLNDILQVGLNGTGGTSQVSISPCATGVTCSLNGPAGFAFDPNGDMFITDGNARVLMVPINHSAANPTSQVPITGLVNPSGVTLDGSGNIFVTDLTGTVTKLMVNAGAMKITALNTSQTTTVTNTGNLNLKITALTFANGASSAYTQTNTCSGAIVPGGNCTITVTYSNAGGSGTDTLNLTTNAFTASGVAIQLSH